MADDASIASSKKLPVQEVAINDYDLKAQRFEWNFKETINVYEQSSVTSSYTFEIPPAPTLIPEFINWLSVNFKATLKTDEDTLISLLCDQLKVQDWNDIINLHKFLPEQYLLMLGIIKYNGYKDLLQELSIIYEFIFQEFYHDPDKATWEFGDYMKWCFIKKKESQISYCTIN